MYVSLEQNYANSGMKGRGIDLRSYSCLSGTVEINSYPNAWNAIAWRKSHEFVTSLAFSSCVLESWQACRLKLERQQSLGIVVVRWHYGLCFQLNATREALMGCIKAVIMHRIVPSVSRLRIQFSQHQLHERATRIDLLEFEMNAFKINLGRHEGEGNCDTEAS